MSQLQQHLWFFYIDIVGSSNSKLTIAQQLAKVKKLNEITFGYLKSKDDPQYKINYTGDGALITFNERYSTMLFELAEYIHTELQKYNKNLDEESRILCRIGIGYGLSILYDNCLDEDKVPWGRDLIISRRIMDNANPNQILLTNSAYQQVISDFNLEKYHRHVKAVGKILPKTGGEEKVYSYSRRRRNGKYAFGNDEIVFPSDELVKKMSIKNLFEVNNVERLQEPIYNIIKKNEEIFIENLNNLLNKRVAIGSEFDLKFSENIFEYLFLKATNYISATHLLPSEHFNLHREGSFYTCQQNLISRILKNSPEPISFYRYLMVNEDLLIKDLKQNKPEEFVRWHENNLIQLVQIDLEKAIQLKTKYKLNINSDVGLGLWSGDYAVEYGRIKRYVRFEDKNDNSTYSHGDTKTLREFILHDIKGSDYNNIVKFFNDLTKVEDKKIINKQYYTRALQK